MKKIFYILSVCILTIILFGCTKSNKNYKIELESNPSTGYSWNYSASEEGIVKLVNEKYNEPTNENMVGVPGTQVYQFKGLKEGTVILTFTYARSWETDVAPVDIKTYTLKVDKNLKIILEKQV